MKKILMVIALLVIGHSAYAAPADYKKDIVTTLSKADGFKRSLMWLAKTVNANGTIVQFQDKESGSILASAGIAPVGVMKSAVLKFTVELEVTDNLIRFHVSDLFTKAITAPANSQGYEVDDLGFEDMYGVKIEAFEQEFEDFLSR